MNITLRYTVFIHKFDSVTHYPGTMKTNTLVARNLVIITLFGFMDGISGASKCLLQTKEEETITFPSMKRGSHSYGFGTLNEIIHSFSEYGRWTTMEIINFKGLRLTCHLAFIMVAVLLQRHMPNHK